MSDEWVFSTPFRLSSRRDPSDLQGLPRAAARRDADGSLRDDKRGIF